MKRQVFFIGVVLIIVASCGASKELGDETQLANLETMIQNRDFKIESNNAYPQTTMALQSVLNSGLLQPGNSSGAISLIGNYNYLKVSGDSISSHLPYFGERQMMVNYGGTDGAITFNGLYEDLNIVKNKNSSYSIKLTAKSDREPFNVFITIFPNLKVDMMLSGVGRLPIRYSGTASKTKEDVN